MDVSGVWQDCAPWVSVKLRVKEALLSALGGKVVFYWHLEAPCDIFVFFDKASWLLL